ncbi:LysR family transcriptional regulator [Vibrio sp. S4M6]|uniref:LysR family transcriptional regulator n=1 Tax=Vibrio sinus TaxID=2946865 RepID=UPI00202A800D|nr:LysR family transcriptional regulator [Vibrio sinus]MCL9781420.1 LysR family transcriptional regulator [Vibrio sinus]
MDTFNWKSVDLNLLVAFQSLYQTHSVSEAAKLCHVSQSAMSHSLQRLRATLNDPLFQRVGNQMQPTPRAHEVFPRIEQILTMVKQHVLAEKPFKAEEYDGVWKIGLTDYAEQLFATKIYDQLRAISPHAQVHFIHVDKANYSATLDSEQLDVVIGSIPNLDSKCLSEHLYREEHLCLYDPEMLTFSRPMTLQEFSRVEHALVSPNNVLSTKVDNSLKAQSMSRRVAVASRNFLTIRQLVRGRKLICIVPEKFAQLSSETSGLAISVPPIEVDAFNIELVYSKSRHHDDKNRWLRENVTASVKSIVSAR